MIDTRGTLVGNKTLPFAQVREIFISDYHQVKPTDKHNRTTESKKLKKESQLVTCVKNQCQCEQVLNMTVLSVVFIERYKAEKW